MWIFLTFYFITIAINEPESQQLDLNTIIGSYGLIEGIGYVWIIRVFILVALAAPLLLALEKKVKSTVHYFSYLACLLLIFEIIRFYTLPFIDSGIFKQVSLVTHFLLPYAIIFAIGLRLQKLSKKEILVIGAINTILFLVAVAIMYSAHDRFVPTQELKHPPSYYYLSYSITISLALWIYAENIAKLINRVRGKPLISFAARNSIWIYLWHIFFLRYYYILENHLFLDENVFFKFSSIFALSIFTTYLQVRTLRNAVLPMFKNHGIKKNIQSLLTG